MQDLSVKYNYERELLGKRFNYILDNSPIYKGNASMLGRDLNNGKKTDSINDYKNGGSMHLFRALQLANLLHIHYSEFYNFNAISPNYNYPLIKNIEIQLEFEQNKITTRINEWIERDSINIESLELQIQEYSKIGENNLYKILNGISNKLGNRISTLHKICIALNKHLYDLTKD